MGKRPDQLLLPPSAERGKTEELGTPTSQSHSEGWQSQANSDSFTGWPWSVRHDYQALQVGSSNNLSQASRVSRTASWDNNDEEFLLGKTGLGGASPKKIHQALFIVIGLNALAMLVEAMLTSQEEVKRVVRVFEMAFTAVFMVLMIRVVRLEVEAFGDAFHAKQVVAEGARKEEMMSTIRTHIADIREAVLQKSTSLEKDMSKRFSKCDSAVAMAKAEATAMRRQLEAVQADAEEMRIAGDDIGARLADLESALASREAEEADKANSAEEAQAQGTLMAALKEKVFGGGGSGASLPVAALSPAGAAHGGDPEAGDAPAPDAGPREAPVAGQGQGATDADGDGL